VGSTGFTGAPTGLTGAFTVSSFLASICTKGTSLSLSTLIPGTNSESLFFNYAYDFNFGT
jgi:hypothetical protein